MKRGCSLGLLQQLSSGDTRRVSSTGDASCFLWSQTERNDWRVKMYCFALITCGLLEVSITIAENPEWEGGGWGLGGGRRRDNDGNW